MFEGVIGDFKAAISNLGEIVRVAMEDQAHVDAQPQDQDQDQSSRTQVIEEYVKLLGAFHQNVDVVVALGGFEHAGAGRGGNWTDDNFRLPATWDNLDTCDHISNRAQECANPPVTLP